MRCGTPGFGLIAFMLACAAAQAAPADQAAEDAKQLAGLFVQSCVRFAGDLKGLRAWAEQAKFAPLPADGQSVFLNGLPGIAYDATNKQGKFVIVSEDGGACSAVAQHADPAAVVASFEGFLRDQKVSFQMTGQHPDSQEAALSHREYSATRNGKPLEMLVSTTAAEGGGEAMLSLTSP